MHEPDQINYFSSGQRRRSFSTNPIEPRVERNSFHQYIVACDPSTNEPVYLFTSHMVCAEFLALTRHHVHIGVARNLVKGGWRLEYALQYEKRTGEQIIPRMTNL